MARLEKPFHLDSEEGQPARWLDLGVVWLANSDNPTYHYKVRLDVGMLLLAAHAAAAHGEATLWAQLFEGPRQNEAGTRPLYKLRITLDQLP